MLRLNIVYNELKLPSQIEEYIQEINLDVIELHNLSQILLYYNLNQDNINILESTDRNMVLITFIPKSTNNTGVAKLVLYDQDDNKLEDSDEDADTKEQEEQPIEMRLDVLSIDPEDQVRVKHDIVYLNYNIAEDNFTFLNEDQYDKYEYLLDDIIMKYLVDI